MGDKLPQKQLPESGKPCFPNPGKSFIMLINPDPDQAFIIPVNPILRNPGKSWSQFR
jgi:hypothetical protein